MLDRLKENTCDYCGCKYSDDRFEYVKADGFTCDICYGEWNSCLDHLHDGRLNCACCGQELVSRSDEIITLIWAATRPGVGGEVRAVDLINFLCRSCYEQQGINTQPRTSLKLLSRPRLKIVGFLDLALYGYQETQYAVWMRRKGLMCRCCGKEFTRSDDWVAESWDAGWVDSDGTWCDGEFLELKCPDCYRAGADDRSPCEEELMITKQRPQAIRFYHGPGLSQVMTEIIFEGRDPNSFYLLTPRRD